MISRTENNTPLDNLDEKQKSQIALRRLVTENVTPGDKDSMQAPSYNKLKKLDQDGKSLTSIGIESQFNDLTKSNKTPEQLKVPGSKAGKQYSTMHKAHMAQTPINIEDMDPVVPDALKPLINHDKADIMSDKSFLKEDIHVSPKY